MPKTTKNSNIIQFQPAAIPKPGALITEMLVAIFGNLMEDEWIVSLGRPNRYRQLIAEKAGGII